MSGSGWPEVALCEAAGLLGLSTEGQRLLRIGHCAVIALPAHGLVARIARPGTPRDRLEGEMRFARYVHQAGLPVLPPADAVADCAIETTTGPVTFWPFVEATGAALDWRWLGETLRRLHALTPPAGMASLWDPLSVVKTRIERYGAASYARAERAQVLSAAYVRAKRIVEDSSLVASVGLVHGDPTNVIVTADGPVLIDFDLSGVGPALWDVASVVVRHRRFGLSGDHVEAFHAAYGLDTGAHGIVEEFLRVRELLDCSFVLTLIGSHDTEAHDELDVRLRALRDPSDRSRWTPR